MANIKAIVVMVSTMSMMIQQIDFAKYIEMMQPQVMEATAYYEGTICFDGSQPRALETCGAAEKYNGCTFLVYECNDGKLGKFLFSLYCNDTGSDYRIEEGTVVDIFMSTYEECITWGRQKVFVQIIRGVEEDG